MIRFVDVTKRFGDKEVLHGLNLHIRKGETMVIMGPSGCGKTVTLKLIVGLIRPDAGQVFVFDEDVAQISGERLDHIRKRIGMLFQSGALFDSMTVAENVAFMLTQHTSLSQEEKRKIVAEKLEWVNLPGVEDLKPAELSGGMRKRVGLARAIAMDPEIILYDEPTTGLDPIMTAEINHLILNLAHNLNITSVVVTHDMRSAFTVADRLAMMHEGRIIAVGTPEEFRQMRNPIVQQFIQGQRQRNGE